MSTMLKTAAMGILSKTLQTFLYKYLLDVDVEGVAMPSLYDGEIKSGWGVRLSNVRLREGIKLMSLPGKRKGKTTQHNHNNDTSPGNVEPDSNDKVEGQNDRTTELSNAQSSVPAIPSEQQLDVAGCDTPPPDSDDEKQYDSDAEDIDYSKQLMPFSESELEETYQQNIRQRTESFESSASYFSSGPPTPPRSTAFRVCFTKETPQRETATTRRNDRSRLRSSVEQERDVAAKEPQNTDRTVTRGGDVVVRNSDDSIVSPLKDGIEDRPEPPLPNIDRSRQNSFEKQQENEESRSTDKGGPILFSDQDMVLRLGAGGRIGTLDVRLVNKEVHVLVEDAFLVVEAVATGTSSDAVGDEDGSKEQAGTVPKSTDGSKVDSKSDNPTNAPQKAKTEKAKGKDKRPSTTTGERVMEKNGIAKILSAIPHLFLRDCRVRFVIRGEESSMNASEEAKHEINTDDTVLEIDIELLSVTNGEDFLAHFHSAAEDAIPGVARDDKNREEASTNKKATEFKKIPSLSTLDASELDANDKNQYMTKRIRTGKGPEGGICMKIFPPARRKRRLDVQHMFSANDKDIGENPAAKWALHSWMASQQTCFFRCSGLDLRARVFLGKKEEYKSEPLYEEDLDRYTIDSMLFGVDGVDIAPLPEQRPSTPTSLQLAGSDSYDDEDSMSWENQHQIQSYPIESAFYKVARGLTPSPCKAVHLPCEQCSLCWGLEEDYVDHELDNSIPMPGLVMNLSIEDPLEINVDRPGLETLGMLKTLFTKPKQSLDSDSDFSTEKPNDASTEKSSDEKKAENTKIPVRKNLYRNSNNFGDDVFPSYMQPEAVKVSGLHLAKVVVRVHIMQGNNQNDCGHSFAYWDIATTCVTMDHQQLAAPESSFQDLRFDIAELNVEEYKGTQSKVLISLGVPQLEVGDNDSQCSEPESNELRSPWPSTASNLLEVPTFLDTLAFESRERHGMQIRYTSVPSQEGSLEESRSLLNIHIGTGNVDTEWKIKNEIITTIGEIKKSLFGVPTKSKDDVSKPKPSKSSSLMKYKVRIDGGNLNLKPMVQVRLPLTVLSGAKSTANGFFLQTLLEKMELAVGKSPNTSSTSPEGRTLFLTNLATLPESVRMRILFFLNDFDSLERALGIKQETNSFLACRAVNKALVKVAKKATKPPKSKKSSRKSKATSSSRTPMKKTRQEMLTKILKLDDSGLQELWSTHQKLLRRGKLLRDKSS